ncbi:unnamed protein product [Closterium sp. NIES-53]
MASPPVLAFDAEGRPVKFETWLDDLHLFLQLTAKDDISLYDHALGHATAPAATADSTARSQWQTRDAHARFAICNSLPIDEREHFGQHKTAQALYTAFVARYSSPASAALGRLSLPYLFPDLASFHTVADLITHLRTSEARFRAAMPDEFLAKNTPPLWLTLYHLVTRLPDTLRSVRDHFLARCPTELTIALLEKEILAAEASIVAVGASRGDPRTPFFAWCSPSPLLPSVASAAAVDLLSAEKVGTASASSGRRSGKGKGDKGGGGDSGGGRRSILHQGLTRVSQSLRPLIHHLSLAQALYDAVVTRYSSPATTALGHLLLPYLFPELSACATVEDLVLLVALRARPSLRGAPPPPLLPPTPLLLLLTSLVLRTSGLLLLVQSAAAASARMAGVVAVAAGVVVGAAVEVVEAVEVVAAVGVVVEVGALVAAVVAAVGVAVVAAVGLVTVGLELSVEVLEEARGSNSSVGARPHRPSSFVSGFLSMGRLGGSVSFLYVIARGTGDSTAGETGVGGARDIAGAGGTVGAAAAGLGGARTKGTGAAETGGVRVAGAGDPTEPGAAGAGGAGAVGAGAGGTGAGVAGAEGDGAVDPGAEGAGGTVRPQSYFCPPPDESQPPLQPAYPLRAPSPYTEKTSGLTERCEPASHPASPVRTGRRVPRLRPPPFPGTHAMALCSSSVPLCVPLPPPPESSLPAFPDPESDRAPAASPTISRLLATIVTDPSFESTAASALVAELVDFAGACCLDYATALVAKSASASPPSVGGECALGTDVLEDRQEDFECLAAAVPRFASMLLAPKGDPDAPDIPTPRSYADAITGPYSSQWQAAMDAEMASWKSTCTYVDAVPPSRANIVDGMWIFRASVNDRGIDYFQTFSPTPKMTTLQVLLHVAAQRDYELHSLDFITTFLQGSLHEEIWQRRPPGFTGSFPIMARHTEDYTWALGFILSTTDPSLFLRTDTSLQPLYVLVYVDDLVFATSDTEALTLVKSELQKRHTCTDLGELRSYLGLQITWDKARRTITLTQSHMVHQVLQRSGFQFSSPQPTPLSTGHSLSAPPSDECVEPSGPYPELVGCVMYLMTCTRPDLAYPLILLARYVAPSGHRKVHWDVAKRVLRYLCSTSGMGLVLGGRGPVVLTGHADASWVDDSATQRSSQALVVRLRSTPGAMAAQKLCWLTYLLTDLGEQPRSPPVLYVDNKAMIALCQEHRLEHRTKHIALRYFLARELQQHGQLRLAYVATRANIADVFTKAVPPGDHQRFVTVLGLVPTLPHLLTA